VVGTIIGSYQIIRKLGEGGMGAVYLAHHALLGRRAAIKVLHPNLSARADIVNRFFNEARAATSISDPGIVQIFDFGYHTDGSAYIVMEYLEGEPLDARLGKLGRIPVVDALRLTRQIASSLAAAHAQNIVHRDLKPENIYLVRDPEVASGERPKILDFGIAKLSDDHPGKVKTHTGALMGTPIYMSPEQCRGASELDHRSDIYALGCVLFHLITGTPPFDGEGMGDIIAAHIKEAPPAASSRVPGITTAVDSLVLRCLAKRPADRYGSMAELAAAIGRLLPHQTSPDAATHLPPYLAGATPLPNPTPLPPSLVPGTPAPPLPTAPTTLGSSVGQVTGPPPSARWPFALAAAIVLAGGAVAVAFVLRGGEPVAPAAQPPLAVIDAAPPDAAPPDAPAMPAHTVPAPDAAVAEVAPDAGTIDAGAPRAPAAAPVKPSRHRPHRRPTGSGGTAVPTGSDCDRSVDVDCDGIPDVR
jgi:serine/threonine protein kinase